MYFWKYWLRKIWLNKCLKSRVSADPETHNMGNGSKIFSNMNDSTFTIIINHCEVVGLEEVSFSDTQNLKTVC